MASDIDTAKTEPRAPTQGGWRSGWRLGSRLGRLILVLNLLSLLILVGGALVLNELRRGLIETRMESLSAQGELIANLISATATRGDPFPALEPDFAALLLQENFIPRGQRARLFDIDGQLVADSYTVSDEVAVSQLPPARKRGKPGETADDRAAEQTRLREARLAIGREVARALTGREGATVRRSETGERVVSVSMPIHRVQAVLGVLVLEAGDVDAIVAAQRRALMPFALVAFGGTLFSSVLLHLFVARPVMRLAAAADQVRLSRARAISLPDLEERKDEIGDLARSLQTMTDTLSTRMDAIERFAADVAHEIKNPLTSIRSAVETLNLVKDDAAKARLTALLGQDVRRLDRLITDISNASRLDAELSRDAPRRVELARLLADLAALIPALAGAARVRLVAEPGDAYAVTGREGPLGQVFSNLIDNARSFSPPEAVVTATLSRLSGQVVVTVEDVGPGIPAENLETVFQRFYTSRPKGTAFGANSGLGLSIARQIVEAHGGTIRAENRQAEDGSITGARFIVLLPESSGGGLR